MAKFKKGGVSMFVVAVASILIVIITSSFVRLMIRDQQQASNQDLSQSAYDSAQAGVEDAKRAFVKWQSTCSSGVNNAACAKMNEVLSKPINEQSCRMLAEVFGIGDPKASETVIQTNPSKDKELNQAYTCVKMQAKTSDFSGDITPEKSKIIRLTGVSDFRRVRISWFSESDAGANNTSLSGAPSDMLKAFPAYDSWPKNHPSVLRAQFVTPDGSMNFGANSVDDKNISRTAFLYPTNNSATNSSLNATLVNLQDASERHNFSVKAISGVRCSNSFSADGYKGYACSAVIDLGRNIGANSGAFLKLNSQYGTTTSYSVEMLNEANEIVAFNGVQPLVDSTGRANSLFRRVQSRIEGGYYNLPIPQFTVSTEGDFCKVMTIRDATEKSDLNCK